MTKPSAYDLLVIGGGINGTGIALDAAGRGLSVLLCEANDLACATSSASSKLIHGGLRYLEHYEFRLVREALAEREVLLRKAPHIIWPLRFVLPDHPGMRPRWMIRAGLMIYDHLSCRKSLPGSSSIRLSTVSDGAAFKAQFKSGFSYWDCWVDDARLVVSNALGARAKGAQIETHSKVLNAKPVGNGWQITIENRDDGSRREAFAKVIVNAAGPWADQVSRSFNASAGKPSANRARLRLIKGSHIVVPKIHNGNDAFILQNADGRVVFVLPYEHDYSLIGTTDEEFLDAPETVSASPAEVEYLLDAVGAFCATRPKLQDVVWQYAGVRALFNDDHSNASDVTRDYRLVLDTFGDSSAPVLSVLGGKITTYRALAEDAANRIATYFPGAGPAWTRNEKLPGGELAAASFEEFVQLMVRKRPGLPSNYLQRLARRHGSRMDEVLGDAASIGDLGRPIGADLYEREVSYLKQQEWARSLEDILWRRTKAGLHLSGNEACRARGLLESIS